MRGMKWVAGLLAVAGLAAMAPARADAAARKTVLVYGDSIMWESVPAVQAKLPANWTLVNRTYPGSGPCSWLQFMAAEVATWHPAVVIVEHSATIPLCEVDLQTGHVPTRNSPELYAKWDSDFDQIASIVSAAGARLVFVPGPPISIAAVNVDVLQERTIMQAVAARYPGVAVSNGPRNAVSAAGKYVAYKACLADETAAQGCDPITHKIAVRTVTGTQAGIHLCPDGMAVAYPFACMSSYSSGERRFGQSTRGLIVNPPRAVVPFG